ncbi:MAG TPA: SDR family oxidoreductase [Moraxellaceae bacterium]|nr:SDR family oxidoreductase [Moraxellaceae bacterium]
MPASLSGRTALVTGASAGIGEAFARLLAAEGANLLLVARREDRLRQLADELEHAHGIRAEVVAADLGQPDAAEVIVAAAQRMRLDIDVLVNNAGFAATRGFLGSEWRELHAEMQVMMVAVTELMHRFAPAMKARGYGRIINLASLAAFAPTAPSMLYTGIKSFVLNVSEAVDMELKPHGVYVTALCPGFTWSEFHDVQGTRELTDKLPGFLWQDAETVARAGLDAVMAGQPVCVPGAVNKTLAYTSRLFPERIRYLMGKAGKMVE